MTQSQREGPGRMWQIVFMEVMLSGLFQGEGKRRGIFLTSVFASV